MSLPDKFIVFLGRTFSGHNHDYSMLKQEFPPDGDWFSDIHVRVDLGYQGMQSDYHMDQLDIPHKNGLLTVFPKMDIRAAHEPIIVRAVLLLSARESVFPDTASPWHRALRRPPPAGGDKKPIPLRY